MKEEKVEITGRPLKSALILMFAVLVLTLIYFALNASNANQNVGIQNSPVNGEADIPSVQPGKGAGAGTAAGSQILGNKTEVDSENGAPADAAAAGPTNSAEAPGKTANQTPSQTDFGQFVSEIPVLNTCGDGICDAEEDCNSCKKDCACKANESCNDFGVCHLIELCGDGFCAAGEGKNKTCCTDCGCLEGNFCGAETETCLKPAAISNRTLDFAISAYLNSTNGAYVLDRVFDYEYGSNPVKVAVLNCSEPASYICKTFIYVDKNGNIINKESLN